MIIINRPEMPVSPRHSGAAPKAPMAVALQQIAEAGAARDGAGSLPKLTTRQYLEYYSEPFRALPEEEKQAICEYLRRVNKEELVAVLQEIKDLPADPAEGASDLDLLKYALREFISGRIDVYDMSAVMLCDACVNWDLNRQYVRVLPLREGEAAQLFKEAAMTPKDSIYPFYKDHAIETLLADPELHDEHIYLVPVPKDANVVRIIAQELEYPFLTIREKGVLYQVVVSPRLMQKLLDIKFRDQAPRINPVLGPSVAFKNFENAKQRDVLVPCRLFPRSHPHEADKEPASPLQFYHHDTAFHAYIVANIPLKHRQAFIELALLFAKDDSSRKLRFGLLDQDFRDYLTRGQKEEDDAITFKASLGIPWVEREVVDQDRQTIRAHIKAHSERWEQQYGIVFNHDVEDSTDWLES